MSGYGKRGVKKDLAVNTTATKRRPSLKRSLSFECPSPSHAGTGPGSWSNHYNSATFNQNQTNQSNTSNFSSTRPYQAPRAGRATSKYSMPATSSTNQATTSSAASGGGGGGGGGGSRSTRRLKKASTWHPNLNQNASPYSDVYSEARRLKQEQEKVAAGTGPNLLNSTNKRTAFTHQLDLSWSQAEHLISSYQVINVNPLYYSATEGPPKQQCMQKWMRGCDSVEVELEGPSYVTDTLFLGDRHDASDRRKMVRASKCCFLVVVVFLL